MPRRSLLTLLALAALVTVAVLAPRTQVGRDWLLTRVQGVAEEAGWSLRWREAAGDPWRTLELRGLEVVGPGVDAIAGYARVTWFAPGLLTGELPLWIEVRNADVALDPSGFGAPSGGSGAPPIRPELRDVDLSGLRIRVGGAAFRIPDLSIDDLTVAGGADSLTASGRLSTRDGGLTLDAVIDPTEPSFRADVRDVDVALARAWWSDLEGGRATGEVAYDPEAGLTAHLDVSEGAFEVAGWRVDQIDGRVGLRDDLVEADLSGATLGGPVAATGRVDLVNRGWSASARATPDLAETVAWAAGAGWPETLRPEGEALVTATASGWRDVTIDASARAEGALDGRPVVVTTDVARYASASGLRIEATGQALGAAVTVDVAGIAPDPDAAGRTPLRTDVSVEGASYGPARDVAGEVAFVVDDGAARGTLAATGALAPGGDPLAAPLGVLDVDGELADGALSLFLSGRPELGGRLEGAATFQDGRLEGGVRLTDAGPLAGQPVAVRVGVDGPLTALTIDTALEGDQPWRPTDWTFAPDLDLRGSARAVLRDGRLDAIDATVGPLTLRGALALTAGDDPGALTGRLDAVRVATGPARAEVRISDLTLVPWTPQGLRIDGTLAASDLTLAAAATLAGVSGPLRLDLPVLATGADAALSARFDGGTLRLDWDGDQVRLEAVRQPATLAGTDVPLDAELRLRLDDPLTSLRGTVTAVAAPRQGPIDAAPALALRAAADDEGWRLNVRLDEGAVLAGVVLPTAAEATAELPLDGRPGALTARVGEVDVRASLTAQDTDPTRLLVDGVLSSGGREARLTADAVETRLALDGAIDLAAVAASVGVEATGTLRATTFALTPDAATGRLDTRLDAPIALDATWSDGDLAGRAATPIGDLSLAGAWAPGRPWRVSAQHPWGRVDWTAEGPVGSGAVPAQAWRGARLGPLPWSLAVDGDAAAVGPLPPLIVRVADGVGRIEDGRLALDLDLPVAIGDAAATLRGPLAWTPDGATVAARLDAPNGATWARVDGAWPTLDATLAAPASTLAAGAAIDLDVRGDVRLSGRLDLSGPAGSATGSWTAGSAVAEVDLAWAGGDLTARLAAPGLQLGLDEDGARVTADGGRLGAFLPVARDVRLDGALAARWTDGASAWRAADWQGRLAVAAAELATVELRATDGPLLASGRADVAGIVARVDGSILPDLALALDVQHPPSGARLAATAEASSPAWTPSDVTLAGTATLPATTGDLVGARYAVAPLRLSLSGTPTDVQLDGGAAGRLSVRDGRWSGSVATDVDLSGAPHRIEVALDGPAAAPRVDARLTGPDVDVDAEYDLATERGTARVRATSGAWPDGWSAAGPGTARVDASVTPGGVWTATLSAELAPGGRALRLDADASGQGATVDARWTTAAAGGTADETVLLAGDARVDAGGVTVRSDVAGWDLPALARWAADGADLPELAAAGTGRILYRRAPDATSRIETTAQIAGRIGDAPVRLVARLDDQASALRLDLDGDTVALGRSSTDAGWTLDAAGDGYAVRGSLAADLRVGRLSGVLAERPLDLRLARTDTGLLAVGRWEATELNVGVLRTGDEWRADVEARRPVADEGALAGALDASARLSDGAVILDRLDLSVAEPLRGHGSLVGPLWPTAALEGRWAGAPASPDAPVAVRVDGDLTAWTARATLAGLTLDAAGSGRTPSLVRAQGASDLLAPIALTTDAEQGLAWSSRDGWRGALEAGLPGEDGAPGSVRARGDDGDLRLTGEAEVVLDGPLAALATLELDARADGPPWAARLIGGATLEARADGRDGSVAATLASDVALAGGLTAPRLSGSVALRGVTSADGTLEADLGGVALTLAGDALDLRATADAAGWSASGEARALPLDPWLPTLAAPLLDLEADASAGWGGDARVTARRVALVADGSRIDGDAVWDDGLRATLAVDADLARALGEGASGRLVGPLSVRADDLSALGSIELSASLRADQVRIAGVAVDGDASLDGSLPFPDVRADLRLAGPLEGTVRVTWLPELQVVDLASDLRDARSDAPAWSAALRLAAADGVVDADGALTTRDGAWTARAEGDIVRLEGDGRWSGSELILAPFDGARGRIEASLPLATLNPAWTGQLRASLAAEQGGVRGRVEDAAAYGVALPTLDLSGEGSTVVATAPDGSLRARVDPLRGAWSLRSVGLPVGEAGRLDADAVGRGTTGRIEASLTGTGSDAVRVSAGRDERATTIDVAGRWSGGDVRLTAERLLTNGAAPWTGEGAVEGAATPAGTLRASVALGGDGPLPTARVDLDLDGPVPTRGIIALDADAAASADLTAELPGETPLRVAGDLWPILDLRLTGSDGTARLEAAAWGGDAPWRLSGATRLTLPGADVSIAGEAVAGEERPTVRLRSDALPGSSLRAELPRAAPADAVAVLAREGLAFEGEGGLRGRIVAEPSGAIASDGLSWASPLGELALAGRASVDAVDLAGSLSPRSDPDTTWAAAWASLAGGNVQPVTIRGSARAVTATFAEGPLEGQVGWTADDATVAVDLDGAGLEASLRLARAAGLRGDVRVDDLRLPLPGGVDARTSGTARLRGDVAEVDLRLAGPGRADLEASWPLIGLLPAGYRPPSAAAAPGRASLRLAAVDVAALPGVVERLPYLAGTLSGVAELRDRRVIVQLAAPELNAAGRPLPLRLEGSGDLARSGGLAFGGTLAGSQLQGSLDGEALELLAVLDRFPGQSPIEALLGPLDADVEATGALRLRLPWQDPLAGELRLATELVRLERAGVVTTGVLAADATRDGLTFDADFRGEGRWTASVVVTPDRLDARLQADEADATPLLGLVPVLARLDTTAVGTLTARASGSPAAPRVAIESPGLEIGLAGTRYRIERASAGLDGADARVSAVVTGAAPIGGRLVVDGTARLDLDERRLEDAAVQLQGDLEVPFVGRLEQLDGRIEADDEGRPALALDGRLGEPIRIEGTLAPLQLSARGRGVTLRIPTLLLDRATADLDLTLRYDERVRLAGSIAASEGRFALGIRPPRPADDAGTGAGGGAAGRGGGAVLGFDDVTIVGRQLSFSESFGSAEFDADLRLSGSASAPRLDGTATARRGTFRFSGRDFRLVDAVARFEPSRGAFPALEVAAVATFDQRAALQGAPAGVAFVQPGGSSFDVRLAFDAEVVPTPGGVRPFDLTIDPVLTSDAEISVPNGGEGASLARPLSEAELLQLVALGRLDLAAGAGAGDVAGGVARSALDNAVDLLVLAELQSAVAQALGVDLVEIRTTALSDVLAGGDDPFGVSLRLGGYLSEGLFASVEVGRVTGENGDAGLRNTLALTYELGPVALDLETRVGFPDAAELAPTTELSGTLRYQLTPLLAIEGGATISTPAAEARFGVTLRW